eukprot:CAMPEP_0172598658 /NCGR_PEP_ID=MMETSP1068-20121228/18714_1 /TAXON_ID=35684 /ORGANISM="Pseudopedinella elastica, Strain CCMP716" /LENGTH=286 /DNA_ID=CAMNT_0013398615 /DNA_START=191 /DNA_END=1054 /DNA_ORIENTATION=-
MKPARVEIAGPGSVPTYVVRAPFAEEPETKRLGELHEKALRDELKLLEEGTKQRNLQFYKALQGIEKHGIAWEAKLREEEAEAQEENQELVVMFEDMLAKTFFAEKKALVNDVERFHVEKIPPQEVRMGQTEDEVEQFVGDTIPAVVDKQSGIVIRELKKANDTFNIENAKVAKREQKIVSRFQRHTERTAQAFEDERATRLSKFMLFGEEVGDRERVFDRKEESTVRLVVAEVAQIRKLLRDELKLREKEDNTLLDTMLYAQQRLQAALLLSFGDGAKDLANDEG